MKTRNTILHSFLTLFVMFTFCLHSFSQCINSSSYWVKAAPTSGATLVLAPCQKDLKYNELTGVTASTQYQVTSSIATDYITVTQGAYNGPVIAHGTQPLNWTSTVSGSYFIHVNADASCTTLSGACHKISVIHVPSTPMAFSSAQITQNNTSTVEKCDPNNHVIIGINVITSGSTSPINATSFRIQTTGSTSPAITSNINNIDIFFTGPNPNYSATNLFGSAAPQIAGTNININGSQTLAGGNNYFWVAYDLNSGANVGDILDAICTRITVGGNNYTSPTNFNSTPAGSRAIAICTPTPGNVGKTNLTAWFKANDLANGNVSSWTTTYPTGGSAITISDNSAPYSQCTNTPASNIFNYNSVVDFNGNSSSNQKWIGNSTSQNLLKNQNAADQGTFFTVYATPSSGNVDGVVTFKNSLDGIQLRGFGRIAIGQSDSPNGARNYTPNSARKPLIISYKGNKSSSTSMQAFKDNLNLSTTFSSSALLASSLTFGAKKDITSTYIEYFAGYISEVIFFDKDLSNNEIDKVNSYLAIKYGITLDNSGGGPQGDYLATNNTTIWDASVNGNYHNNVIGIGRDDGQSLHQKQSHTFNDTTRIYLSNLAATNAANTGSFSTDVSYIVIGDNQGKMCTSPSVINEIPASCGLYSRLEREWKVTKTNVNNNFSFSVKLNACANPTLVNIAHLRLLVDDDGNFANGGTTCYANGDAFGTVITYNNPVITVSGISSSHITNNSTKYITIASTNPATPLPVDLLNFKANCNNGNVVLEWITASEINNDYFTIEKSTDALNFSPIGVVNGNGNSNTTKHYKWIDNKAATDSYYRLKQTDFDGNYEYFKVISAQCESNSDITIYPNPFSNQLLVNLPNNPTQQFLITIKDYLGRTVTTQHLNGGNNPQHIATKQMLSKGFYFITITNNLNEEIYHQKIIKQ